MKTSEATLCLSTACMNNCQLEISLHNSLICSHSLKWRFLLEQANNNLISLDRLFDLIFSIDDCVFSEIPKQKGSVQCTAIPCFDKSEQVYFTHWQCKMPFLPFYKANNKTEYFKFRMLLQLQIEIIDFPLSILTLIKQIL